MKKQIKSGIIELQSKLKSFEHGCITQWDKNLFKVAFLIYHLMCVDCIESIICTIFEKNRFCNIFQLISSQINARKSDKKY